LKDNAEGLDALGATRSKDMSFGLGWRDTDDEGEAIEPVFDRNLP
jgi:hypothetical protein